MNKEEIRKQIIQNMDYVKAPDRIFSQIVQAINQPDLDITLLFKIIEQDIELTASILRLCNSAMYNLKHEISSLREAIIYVGYTELKRLIMSVKIKKYLNQKKSGYEAMKGELWQHSMATAIISKHLEKKVSDLDADLYTTALLHDIGKIFLGGVVEDFSEKIKNFIKINQCDFLYAEDVLFGINHAELGALLMDKWQFPKPMIFAVRYHHEALDIEPHTLTDMVALANTIAQSMGYSTSFDALKYPFNPRILERHGIKRIEIEFLILESLEDIKRIVNRQNSSLEGNGK